MVRYSEKLASVTVMIFFIFCNSSMSWITYQIQLCCVNSPWINSSFFAGNQFYWSLSLSKSLSMAFCKVRFLEWYCSSIYKMIFNPVPLTSQLLSSMVMTQVEATIHLWLLPLLWRALYRENITKSYKSVIILQKQNGYHYLKYCLCPVPITSQHHWKACWCLLISKNIRLQNWNILQHYNSSNNGSCSITLGWNQ